MAALTASSCVVTALLAPLLPQIFMCTISDPSDYKNDLSRFLRASSNAAAAAAVSSTCKAHTG